MADGFADQACQTGVPLPRARLGTDTLFFYAVTVACVRVRRYEMAPSPEDSRYRDSLSPPCSTLVVDNVSPDVSTEAITAIFAKVGTSTSWGLCFPLACSNSLVAFQPLASTEGARGERVSVHAVVLLSLPFPFSRDGANLRSADGMAFFPAGCCRY